MASELKVNTLTGVSTAGSIAVTGEGNSTTTNLQNGLCKAWVNADSDASRNNGFNFDGQTDHGTGDFSYELINHMSATNAYSQSGLARASTDAQIITRNTTRDTAGVVAVEVGEHDGSLVDRHHDIQIVGELA